MMFLMNDVVLTSMRAARPRCRQRGSTPCRCRTSSSWARSSTPPIRGCSTPTSEKARRLAMLILAKAPDVNAALFVAPADKCTPDQVVSRFANLSFEVIAGLFRNRKAGALNAVTADREVWRRLAA